MPYRTTAKSAYLVSFAALAGGSLCLLKDLALAGKAFLLFSQPTLSAISVGAYALIGLLVCLGALTALETKSRSRFHTRLRFSLSIVAALLAVTVIVYTGILLFNVPTVPLWHSPFLPLVFFFSSLSSGIAGLIIVILFTHGNLACRQDVLRAILKLDAALIALEALSLALFSFQVFGNGDAAASLERLTTGPLALPALMGFVACGLAIPLFMEVVLSNRLSKYSPFCSVAACLILIGAFFLRYCAIFGGTHLSAGMLG